MNEETKGMDMVVEEDKEHLDESVSQIKYPTSEIELAEVLEETEEEDNSFDWRDIKDRNYP